MAVYNLGHLLNDQWRSAEALGLFRRAVALDPHYQPARHALLFNLLYDPDQTEQSLHDEHLRWGCSLTAGTASITGGSPRRVQPAPVQVAWLGYPATAGLPQIGYRLTDAEADPPGAADALHVERLVLKGQLLAHASTRAALTAEFAAHGIGAERIELRRWLPRAGNPMAAYHDIDIALDTFPYNGTTTSFEALWMGVPVVTLRGTRHAARVGASILGHLGRSEWIADDLAGYQRIAVELASRPDALAAQRRTLRDALRASTLCDAGGFARKLEAIYRELVGA